MVAVDAVAVLRDKWISLAIVCWIDTCARRTGSHGLVSVLARVELLLVLVVVDALDHLGSHEGGFCDDALERHHVVQLV